MSSTKPIEQVTIGTVILPPKRELSLWMRKHCAERGLPESALALTVRDIYEGTADKVGRWIIVKCDHSAAWLQGRQPYTFNFKARPSTPWTILT